MSVESKAVERSVMNIILDVKHGVLQKHNTNVQFDICMTSSTILGAKLATFNRKCNKNG